MTSEHQSYAAFCAGGCGVIRAAIVDAPGDRCRVARFLAEHSREGMRIERVESEQVRQQMGRCRCAEDQGTLFPDPAAGRAARRAPARMDQEH